jgi:hypothetical protein
MGQVGKLLVFGYLLFVILLMIYLVSSLWMVNPATESFPKHTFNEDEQPKDGTPIIKDLYPHSIEMGGNRSNVVLFGYNFSSKSTVQFNDMNRVFQVESPNELLVSLSASDFVTPGAVAITVTNGSQRSNPVDFEVRPAGDATVQWQLLGQRHITLELRLILLVLFTGVLASCVYGLKSFGDYAGEQQLQSNWYWFYMAKPFIGAGMAFVFYLVVRAGFLAGTTADIKAVNPFGFVAIAALVGLYSDKALQKLGDVFDTLFKTEDTRSEKLKPPKIVTTSLPAAHKDADYPAYRLEATGGKPPYHWTSENLPVGLTLTADGSLGGKPSTSGIVKFKIQVTDSAPATDEKEFELTIT